MVSPSQRTTLGTPVFKGTQQFLCLQKECRWKILYYNEGKPASSPRALHVAFKTKAWVMYRKLLVHKNHVVLSLNLMRVTYLETEQMKHSHSFSDSDKPSKLCTFYFMMLLSPPQWKCHLIMYSGSTLFYIHSKSFDYFGSPLIANYSRTLKEMSVIILWTLKELIMIDFVN